MILVRKDLTEITLLNIFERYSSEKTLSKSVELTYSISYPKSISYAMSICASI